MRGFWFYFFLGLTTSTLFARGLPRGPVAFGAIGAVSVLAVGFWLYLLLDVRRERGTFRGLVVSFLWASPLTYAAGFMGGYMIFRH
jgi:hypothetical protein